MSEYLREREIQRKREYHRNWRKNHPEAVRAAQMRYWAKKAEEMRNQVNEPETRSGECEKEGL